MSKVVIISQHFPPERSGNASRIYDMAVNLSKQDLDIVVLSPPPTFPTGSFKRTWKLLASRDIDGIKNSQIWTWQPVSRDPKFLDRIAYYLIFPLCACFWILANYNRFDIIITSSPPLFTGIPGFMAKKLFNKPWILDVRDRWIDASISLGFLKKGSLYEKLSRNFERLCYTNSDLIAVTTRELGKKVSSSEEIAHKIVLIPNGVDTDYFYPLSKIKKNQIIYAGNVGYAQDLDKVIIALKQIIKKHDLRLLIVGDGDIKEQLEEVVKKEGLEDNVIFTGVMPRDKIPQLLSESLIGLAPLKKMETLEYAVPTKAYEYMACGIPFLGCGNGEILSLAVESGAGVIVDNTPEAIAKEVLKLLNNREEIELMGKNGRNFVKSNYDRKGIALKLKQCIEMIQ